MDKDPNTLDLFADSSDEDYKNENNYISNNLKRRKHINTAITKPVYNHNLERKQKKKIQGVYSCQPWIWLPILIAVLILMTLFSVILSLYTFFTLNNHLTKL